MTITHAVIVGECRFCRIVGPVRIDSVIGADHRRPRAELSCVEREPCEYRAMVRFRAWLRGRGHAGWERWSPNGAA